MTPASRYAAQLGGVDGLRVALDGHLGARQTRDRAQDGASRCGGSSDGVPPPKKTDEAAGIPAATARSDLGPARRHVLGDQVGPIGPRGEGAVVAATGAERDVHVHPERAGCGHGPTFAPTRSPFIAIQPGGPTRPASAASSTPAATAADSVRSTPGPSRTTVVALRPPPRGSSRPRVRPAPSERPGVGGPPVRAAIATPGRPASEAGVLGPAHLGHPDLPALHDRLANDRPEPGQVAVRPVGVPAHDPAIGSEDDDPVNADLGQLLHRPFGPVPFDGRRSPR